MMIEHHWTIAGIEELVKQYPVIVREEAVKCMQIITARLEKDVVENTPAGVGGAAGLRGSIAGRVDVVGDSVRGVVGTAMPYGEVVELGRKPGSFPPREGTKGAHMFQKAWDKDQNWAMDQMQGIVTAVVRRANGL